MMMELAGDRPPRYGNIETGRSLLRGRNRDQEVSPTGVHRNMNTLRLIHYLENNREFQPQAARVMSIRERRIRHSILDGGDGGVI